MGSLGSLSGPVCGLWVLWGLLGISVGRAGSLGPLVNLGWAQVSGAYGVSRVSSGQGGGLWGLWVSHVSGLEQGFCDPWGLSLCQDGVSGFLGPLTVRSWGPWVFWGLSGLSLSLVTASGTSVVPLWAGLWTLEHQGSVFGQAGVSGASWMTLWYEMGTLDPVGSLSEPG